MFPHTDSSKAFRLSRDRSYRRRVLVALSLSVVVHVVAIVVVAPFRDRIPLVRTIGYLGPTHILPEIYVVRDVGPSERELHVARGVGGRNVFRIVPITITDWEVPEGESETSEVGDESDDIADDGLDLLHELEMALPQPRSQEMIVAHLVRPTYPKSSRAAGVEGVVVFRVHVTKTGEVANVWLLTSEVDRACEQSARRALYMWRYLPYLVDGEAVGFLWDQPVRFRLYDVESGVTGGVRSHFQPTP